MEVTLEDKSTVEEIRARFDADVERFSNLETGQVAAMDSPLHMSLVAEAAAGVSPHARAVLDIGCGAGNYTLKLLEELEAQHGTKPRDVGVTLLDLSAPMLERAEQRLRAAGVEQITLLQCDVREAELGHMHHDIVLAAQCLHHLRAESEWAWVFRKVYRGLRLGGGFWIADSVAHENPAVWAMMRRRWAQYLESLNGPDYRAHVMDYVDQEDSPRSVEFQTQLMRRMGFAAVDVLHSNCRFACFGAVRPPVAPQPIN